MSAKDTDTLLTRDSVPTEVDFYAPKSTGIHKFEFFYGRDLLYTQGFYPIWTSFDIGIINLAKNGSPLTLIEHGWDRNRERGRLLFDSMDASFKRFATIDLQGGKKRHWLNKAIDRIFEDLDLVGIWELHPQFVEYFRDGDGAERGAFWYIYCLRRPMSSGEFVSLLMEHCYKFRNLLDKGIPEPETLQCENIVTHPDVETFVFKDFMSARLCVSTSSPLISQKIIEFSRQADVVAESKLGDVCLVSVDYLTERCRFLIQKPGKNRK